MIKKFKAVDLEKFDIRNSYDLRNLVFSLTYSPIDVNVCLCKRENIPSKPRLVKPENCELILQGIMRNGRAYLVMGLMDKPVQYIISYKEIAKLNSLEELFSKAKEIPSSKVGKLIHYSLVCFRCRKNTGLRMKYEVFHSGKLYLHTSGDGKYNLTRSNGRSTGHANVEYDCANCDFRIFRLSRSKEMIILYELFGEFLKRAGGIRR
ncbi:MAG: hypothetical protein QXL94_01660 [Candidatus Parvarchaeum sp.]